MPAHAIPLENKVMRFSRVGECWEYSGTISVYGYGQFHHMGKTIRAHRASYVMHNGKIPEGKIICHKCDNRRCINPDHLYAGTHADNLNDAYKRKRHPGIASGAAHHNAKLTPEKVAEIRSSSLPQRELAQMFGVSQTTISEIKRNVIWKDG